MSIQTTPDAIIQHTVGFLSRPRNVTHTGIKRCAEDLTHLALTNRRYRNICQGLVTSLRTLDGLVRKYNSYNNWYQLRCLEDTDWSANPHLLDAVFTGWEYPGGDHSCRKFTDETVNDIREIVRLTPGSIGCTMGSTRCCNSVTPLAAACLNKEAPVAVVPLLLQRGADPETTILYTGSPVKLIDLVSCAQVSGLSQTRITAIRQLFSAFSAGREEGKKEG